MKDNDLISKRKMGSNHTKYFLWVLVIASLLFLVNYLFFDTLYFKCIIKELTGYDCPTCGAQRAFISILNGEIIKAFWYNPYLVLLLFVGLVLIFINKDYLNKRKLNYIITTLVILMIMWVIIRNLSIWKEFVSAKIVVL